MKKPEIDVNKVQAALDNLLDAVRKTTARKIDAGACQTKRDRELAHRAEDAEEEALDAFWFGLLGTAKPEDT